MGHNKNIIDVTVRIQPVDMIIKGMYHNRLPIMIVFMEGV